jgi:hypothetical protein
MKKWKTIKIKFEIFGNDSGRGPLLTLTLTLTLTLILTLTLALALIEVL